MSTSEGRPTDGSDTGAKDNSPPSGIERKGRWWWIERLLAVVGGLASLVTVIGLIVLAIEHTPTFEMHHEEALVSQLAPGETFDKMVQVLGSVPNYKEALKSGNTINIFNRKWETLQLLVDRSGTVLSMGVYAKVSAFQLNLPPGVTLNGPSIAAQEPNPYTLVSAYGFCGADAVAYYEVHSSARAVGSYSVILGTIDSGFSPSSCEAVNRCMRTARGQYFTPKLSRTMLSCMTTTSAGRKWRTELSPSMIIVVAPGQKVTSDMLNEDYFLR